MLLPSGPTEENVCEQLRDDVGKVADELGSRLLCSNTHYCKREAALCMVRKLD